jgi:tetratricopeptide (TPR) repeat protein
VSKLPERIGKYHVVGHIGRGGMGSVYKAHDPHLERMVAIKVMTEEANLDTEARARFMREARSAARLNHPNVITVYELGEESGRTFIVMELLEGVPLSRVIERQPPASLREKLAIMIQVCDGLAFAHQRGVVHRDVKPANIFVLESGQVKILDFGIARLATSDLTRTGLLMGTPHYMSPEQARGRRTDARSDIFSAGVVCYELLSGRRPFPGAGYLEVLESLRSEEPTPLGQLLPDLPAPAAEAVHRAMAKDLAERFQRIEDLRRVLADALDVLDTSGGEELREAVGRRLAEVVRLHRVLVATVGAAALGDEKLPVLDQGTTGVGLRTLLRDLEQQADRLHAFARRVEELEPAVARGMAAAERGAYAEAARELDAVLAEIPQHQRAREYRERVRIEQELDRTVRAFGVVPPAIVTEAGTPRESPPAPVPATAAGSSTSMRTARSGPPRVTLTRAMGTGAVMDDTHGGWGRRGHRVLVGVAVLAVVAGGVFLFGPLGPRPTGWGGRPGGVEAPRAPQLPAGTGAGSPSAPSPGRAPEASQPAPSDAGPTPATPTPTPKPTVGSPADGKTSLKAAAAEPKPKPVAKTPAADGKGLPSDPKRGPKTPAPEAKAPPAGAGSAAKAPAEARSASKATPAPAAPRPLTDEQQKAVEDTLTLAQLFQARGDNERARREYRRALDIDPTHAEAKQGLAQVEETLRGKR